jgi:hypothetical protein
VIDGLGCSRAITGELGSLPAAGRRAHRLTATRPFGSTLVSPTRLADPAENAGSLVMQFDYVEKNYAAYRSGPPKAAQPDFGL